MKFAIGDFTISKYDKLNWSVREKVEVESNPLKNLTVKREPKKEKMIQTTTPLRKTPKAKRKHAIN